MRGTGRGVARLASQAVRSDGRSTAIADPGGRGTRHRYSRQTRDSAFRHQWPAVVRPVPPSPHEAARAACPTAARSVPRVASSACETTDRDPRTTRPYARPTRWHPGPRRAPATPVLPRVAAWTAWGSAVYDVDSEEAQLSRARCRRRVRLIPRRDYPSVARFTSVRVKVGTRNSSTERARGRHAAEAEDPCSRCPFIARLRHQRLCDGLCLSRPDRTRTQARTRHAAAHDPHAARSGGGPGGD